MALGNCIFFFLLRDAVKLCSKKAKVNYFQQRHMILNLHTHINTISDQTINFTNLGKEKYDLANIH